ncbi:hypothetical protein ACFO25_09835 [Paenactinomyces guangxiensis]|uniref:Uncharacterized protein n=1 Tax=Paenactinomyces guangxiensis TaxID=1490290 RepID=A0A7W1WS68_9BACL|nr:hypothetical protein [Paenactinomyces guangxiensis]MBA4495084.1 hypothetical protein [Paenactinomyces guangxiensis]MBH8592232.1 hypothetical protein [Paenactinomyces guangxiensis]
MEFKDVYTLYLTDIMERFNVDAGKAEEIFIKALVSNVIFAEISEQVDFLVEREGIEEKKEEKLKHKNISLTEFKKMFPGYKLTKKTLISYIKEGYDTIKIDGTEIDISANERVTHLTARFIKDGWIYCVTA